MALGEKLGITSTPTFFINGRRIVGFSYNVPYDAVKSMVDFEVANRRKIRTELRFRGRPAGRLSYFQCPLGNCTAKEALASGRREDVGRDDHQQIVFHAFLVCSEAA